MLKGKSELNIPNQSPSTSIFGDCIFLISGEIMRQVNGIPIGGPTTPPLAILSCAYNEHALLTIPPSSITIQHFTQRYIDDTIALLVIPRGLPDTNVADSTWTMLTSVYPEQMQVRGRCAHRWHIQIPGLQCGNTQYQTCDIATPQKSTNPMGVGCAQTFPRFPHFLGPAAERTKSSVLSTMLHAAHAASST